VGRGLTFKNAIVPRSLCNPWDVTGSRAEPSRPRRGPLAPRVWRTGPSTGSLRSGDRDSGHRWLAEGGSPSRSSGDARHADLKTSAIYAKVIEGLVRAEAKRIEGLRKEA